MDTKKRFKYKSIYCHTEDKTVFVDPESFKDLQKCPDCESENISKDEYSKEILLN